MQCPVRGRPQPTGGCLASRRTDLDMIPGRSASLPSAARFRRTVWAIAVDSMGQWGNKCSVLKSCCLTAKSCAHEQCRSLPPVPISPALHRRRRVFGLITEATLQVFPLPKPMPSWPSRFRLHAWFCGGGGDGERRVATDADGADRGLPDRRCGAFAHRARPWGELYLVVKVSRGWSKHSVDAPWRSAHIMAAKTSGSRGAYVLEQSSSHRRTLSAGSPTKSTTRHPRHPSEASFDYIHVALPTSQVLRYREDALDLCSTKGSW